MADGVTCEVYRCATRYIVMTGNQISNHELINIDGAIDATVAELDPPRARERVRQGPTATTRLPLELRLMLALAGDRPAGYPSRSELLWAFLNAALRKNVDENTILESCLDRAYIGNSIFEHVADNGGEDYVKRQIERATNQIHSDPKNRTIIQIGEGQLHEKWRATELALITHNCPVYVRGVGGNHLVQPIWRLEKVDGRNVLTARFERYNVERLSDVVAHHAVQFQKYDRQVRRWKDIDPPEKLIKTIIEIKQWCFTTVVGIINSPTMRPDGSLLTTPGYDPETKLWYKSSGDLNLPSIPDNPTVEEAQKALKLLNELLTEFPFDEEEEHHSVSHSAALAGIMTPVLRGALPTAVPLFAIIATEPRSGKTYLVHLISMVATGHIPVPIAGNENPEEMEKRIETAALSGRPIMHLNNLPNGMVVDSTGLAQLSTEGHIMIRKLGKHEEGLCDCKGTTVFLNGNNILIAADLVPRTVACRLNAQMEDPETRTFKDDPIERVRADRSAYLAAVFTIARAFKAAGYPKQECKVVAGFEAWSRLVQQPLIWLGEKDPLGAMDELRAIDPTQDELQSLLSALRSCFAVGVSFTVADCVKLAEQMRSDGSGRPHFTHQYLRDVMIVQGRTDQQSFVRPKADASSRSA